MNLPNVVEGVYLCGVFVCISFDARDHTKSLLPLPYGIMMAVAYESALIGPCACARALFTM